jgi:hypothetical protein
MVMNALAKGHGYQWLVLARRPVLLAYGEPALGDMPQLLFAGRATLVVADGDPAYVGRLRRMLEILERQEEKQIGAKEPGVSE